MLYCFSKFKKICKFDSEFVSPKCMRLANRVLPIFVRVWEIDLIDAGFNQSNDDWILQTPASKRKKITLS